MKIIYIPNRIIDSDGISDGASIYAYQTGTTTKISLYADPGCTVPVANPYVVALGAAVPPLYYNYSGDIRLYVVSLSGEIQDTDPYYSLTTSADLAEVNGAWFGISTTSSDNYAAINAARAVAVSLKKPLRLPPGTLTINQAAPSFALNDDEQIIGSPGTTLHFTGLGSTGEVFNATGKSRIKLSNFKMEASVLQTTSQIAVSLKDCVDCVVEDCTFDKWTNSVVFWTALSTGPVPPQTTNLRNKAVRCVSLSSRQYGFYQNFATACEFLHCTAKNSSAYDGFKFGGGSMFAKVIGCHAEGCAGDGFDTYDGFINSVMADCTSYNNTSNGFQFKGTLDGSYSAGDYVTRSSSFSGLVAKGNGLAGFLFQEMRLGTATGLVATNNGTSGFVVNNVQETTFTGCSAQRNTQHGWSIIGVSSRCTFTGCSATDNSYVDGTVQNGTYDGFNVNTATNSYFVGCRSSNGTQVGKLGGQGYAFNLTTSTSLYFTGGSAGTSVTGPVNGETGNRFTGFDKAGTFEPAGPGTAFSSSGLGYATGAGGAVTQLTSKSTTTPAINKATGQITLNNAALASGAKAAFNVPNSLVAATDTIIVNVGSGGTANAYRAVVTAVNAGSFVITVENITAGSLSETPVINFAVIKGVAA